MSKRYLTFCVVCMLLMVAPFAWAAEEMSSGDLMELLPPGEHNDQLSRGEYAVMLSNAAGFGEVGAVLPADVSVDAWYAEDVNKLLGHGIIRGYTDGTVRPEQTITRVEAVVMLSRVLGLPVMPAENISVVGLEQHAWAAGPYTWCVKEGLLSPTASPSGLITRQEGDTLLVGAFATNNLGREINKKSEQKIRDAVTMRLDGIMNISMELIPEAALDLTGKKDGRMYFSALMNTELNIEQGMYQSINMRMPQIGDVRIPEMKMEQYYTEQGLFMQVVDPVTGESEWIKYPANMLPDFKTIMDRQRSMASAELDELFYYRVLDDVLVNGKNCYQVAFYGQIDNFNQLLSMLAQDMPDVVGTEQLMVLDQSFINSMSFMGVSVISKDDYLPVRVDTQALITFNKELLGEEAPFRAMRTNYVFNYNDLNKTINIALPEEALEAEELTFN